MQPGRFTDTEVEELLGSLLRTGVLLAGGVVAVGGLLYLSRHGLELPEYHAFHQEASNLRTVKGIFYDLLAFHGRGVIQFGILLLIATPIARVAFSMYAFARERDYLYVIVAAVVLVLLLVGMLNMQ